MIELLKFIRGYVVINVTGFSPERFMNLCTNKDILLWDIYKKNESYYMSITLKSFYLLRPIVKKTGTKAVIVKRCGLPFFIPQLWSRKSFIFGFLACFIFWIVSQQYIWRIEIQGNYQITSDIFMDFLESNDVHVGSLKNNLGIVELEKSGRAEFPVITWISIKLEGTTLVIDIKENTVLSITQNNDDIVEGKDIYADIQGIIYSIFVRKGVPSVSVGEEVEVGQLLVTGLIPIVGEDGVIINYQITDADADILIKYPWLYNQSITKKYNQKIYTGREYEETYLRINLNQYKISGKKENYELADSIIEQNKISLFNWLNIPIYLEKIIVKEYKVEEAIYEKEEGGEVLLEQLNLILKSFIEKGVQIVEKNVRIEETNTQFIILGEFVFIGPAGEQRDIVLVNEDEEDAELEQMEIIN